MHILASTAVLFWNIFMQNELKIQTHLGILFNFIGVVHFSGHDDVILVVS